jgi:hypothetical protein
MPGLQREPSDAVRVLANDHRAGTAPGADVRDDLFIGAAEAQQMREDDELPPRELPRREEPAADVAGEGEDRPGAILPGRDAVDERWATFSSGRRHRPANCGSCCGNPTATGVPRLSSIASTIRASRSTACRR